MENIISVDIHYSSLGVNLSIVNKGKKNNIHPFNGWEGIGLKIWGQYEKGNNNWHDYNNNKDEYAITYYGLNNKLTDKNVNISELNVYANETINY